MENNNNKLNIQFEKFARNITPLPIESKERDVEKMVKWGTDNLYPNFLIDIANNSSIHGGILDKKAIFLYGDGVIDKKSTENIGDLITINEDGDTIGELTRKAINDFVVFGGFAIKVDFNILNEPLYYTHLPFNHVRSNKNKSKFFVNDDWHNNPRTYLSYPKYNVKNNEDGISKVFYFNSYSISVNNVYPNTGYKCVLDAVTDMLISQFFNNNIANGFSLTKILKTFKGVPADDEKRRATQKFKDVFTGIEGEGLIIDFNNEGQTGISVDTIQADDYASKLIEVIKKVEKNILSAHGATSPLLFGIDKEGSSIGGNGSELNVAYEIYKASYVNVKVKEIVSALNKLFQSDENIPVIDIAVKDKIVAEKVTLSDATLEKILTKNELRELIGFEKLVEGGDDFVPQTFKPNTFSKKKVDELESYSASPEDFEKVKHLGNSKSEFLLISESKFSNHGTCSCSNHSFATSKYLTIEEYLLDNKIVGMTIDEATAKISNELGYDVAKKDVQRVIDTLKANNLIETKTNTATNVISTSPAPIMSNPNTVEVYYDYKKRPDVSGAEIIPTTRHFCESIINSDKYYSAKDIQSFSAVLGYDVMKYRGGWFKNSKTGETTPYCRHEWVAVKVIKR